MPRLSDSECSNFWLNPCTVVFSAGILALIDSAVALDSKNMLTDTTRMCQVSQSRGLGDMMRHVGINKIYSKAFDTRVSLLIALRQATSAAARASAVA